MQLGHGLRLKSLKATAILVVAVVASAISGASFPETDITNLLKPCRHEACFVRIGILKYSCLLFQLLPFSSCTSWNSGRGCT
jgi:hypothetical protein